MTEARRIGITETIFRDAHQSLLATRMRLSDMLQVAELMDEVGYHSLEVWGGATFDSCIRYLDEDPWMRLRELRKHIKKTPLQMLLRGQNLVGYRHYPDDAVREFCKKSIENGIDIVRIFDALNDIRNLEVAVKATKEAGGHAQATVVYTLSPVHNTEHYVETAKRLKAMGADSICIKDMAGLMSPSSAFELISRLKAEISIPIQLHTHYTSGMGAMTYQKAVEAGVDVIDTALSSLALGTSQPATEVMVAALQGTPYDTGLDLKLLKRLSDHFAKVKEELKEFAAPLKVDTQVLITQIPGGMLSNLRAQMTAQGILDKWDMVMEEIPKVREELGYPPLVTPMSQIVGAQAVLNVALGQRWAIKTKEVKDYLQGLYGASPAPIDEEFRKMIIGDAPVITRRPADDLEPILGKAREEIKEYITQDEDVLTYVLFPEQALEFFKRRQSKQL